VVVSSVALTLRLDMAVLQSKASDSAIKIVFSVVFINILISFFLFFIIFIFLISKVDFFNREVDLNIALMFFLGILSSSSGAINLLSNAILVRDALFKQQAIYRLYFGSFLTLGQIGMVYYSGDALGLIIAYASTSLFVTLL